MVIALAVSALVLAGCGGDDDTTVQPASTLSPSEVETLDPAATTPVVPIDTVFVSQDDLAEQLAEPELPAHVVLTHLITAEGWEYDITLFLPDNPITARSDFSTAPPGESDLILQALPLAVSYEGTLPGRTAPQPNWTGEDFIWIDSGTMRFAGGEQCRIHTDGEIDIATNGSTVVYCRSAFIDYGSTFGQAEIDATPQLNGVVRMPEADASLWVDYFANNPTPDFVAFSIGSKGSFCSALIGYDGSVRVISDSEAATTGIFGTNDGCVWTGTSA